MSCDSDAVRHEQNFVVMSEAVRFQSAVRPVNKGRRIDVGDLQSAGKPFVALGQDHDCCCMTFVIFHDPGYHERMRF
jgi:hypothetical protein